MFFKINSVFKKMGPIISRCVPFLILCGVFLERLSKSDGEGKSTEIAR